jgi:antirestriction protein ArdC
MAKEPNERKERLINLSNLYRSSVHKKTDEENLCMNCNEFVLKTYTKETNAQDWKTFKAWKKAGFKVKKGEKGFPIWSKPIETKAKTEQTTEGFANSENFRKNEYSFFAVAYLFNNLQVDKI